jgi:curved DNA-binding protein
MRFVDYYEVMGVAPEASADEIKKAYRRLARKYHPDVSKEAGAEEKFKQVGEAYEVLKDPTRRAEYDELRRYGGRHPDDFKPPPGWHSRAAAGDHFGAGDAQRFSEFFEAIFGAGARGARGFDAEHGAAWPGEDIHYRLQVSLEEAAHGGTRTITIAGGGRPGETRTLKVRIPQGIAEGRQIRLKGQGHPGHGGAPAGDLYLHVEYAPHPLFTVEGRDLTMVLPLAPWEAVLGASVTVPTLDGAVKLTIPVQSRAGQKLRIAGKGLRADPPGDLYVVLQIVVPPQASERARALYRELAEEAHFDPRAGLRTSR